MTKVVNKYKEPCDVDITRNGRFGNPFPMKDKSDEERDRVCDQFEEWYYHISRSAFREYCRHELKDKRLGCVCKPKRCHGDTYVKDIDGQ